MSLPLGFLTQDLSLIPVTTLEEVLDIISLGLKVRATHETKMNQVTISRQDTHQRTLNNTECKIACTRPQPNERFIASAEHNDKQGLSSAQDTTTA